MTCEYCNNDSDGSIMTTIKLLTVWRFRLEWRKTQTYYCNDCLADAYKDSTGGDGDE